MRLLAQSRLAVTAVIVTSVPPQWAEAETSKVSGQPTSASETHGARHCAGKPGVSFICGPRNSEDLIAIPESPWIIASGLANANGSSGALYLIDRRDNSWKTLDLSERAPNVDGSTFASSAPLPTPQCTQPVDPSRFSAHGIHLREGTHGLHTLYVVNHGTRESIEIFELDAVKTPTVHWKDCLILPGTAVGNSVAPLPGGGIVVTVSNLSDDAHMGEKVQSGRPTGYVLEWHAKNGWKQVPGSEGSFPNGIEVSPDGRWIYVTNTGTEDLVRLSLYDRGASKAMVNAHIYTDNLRWDSNGQLWIAGQLKGCGPEPVCGAPYAILRLDPKSLHLTQVPHPSTAPEFGAASVALPVEHELWVSTYQGDRIARFPLVQ